MGRPSSSSVVFTTWLAEPRERYARSLEEATEVLESSARGALTITSLAEESRPPAAAPGDSHGHD